VKLLILLSVLKIDSEVSRSKVSFEQVYGIVSKQGFRMFLGKNSVKFGARKYTA
jgi:hypothetical protein